jgi:hypothetical protein
MRRYPERRYQVLGIDRVVADMRVCAQLCDHVRLFGHRSSSLLRSAQGCPSPNPHAYCEGRYQAQNPLLMCVGFCVGAAPLKHTTLAVTVQSYLLSKCPLLPPPPSQVANLQRRGATQKRHQELIGLANDVASRMLMWAATTPRNFILDQCKCVPQHASGNTTHYIAAAKLSHSKTPPGTRLTLCNALYDTPGGGMVRLLQ